MELPPPFSFRYTGETQSVENRGGVLIRHIGRHIGTDPIKSKNAGKSENVGTNLKTLEKAANVGDNLKRLGTT